MNKNKILIIVLIGLAGIILYQVLFGFILPIVLFVVLMSILKGLIKGFDQDQKTANSEIIDNNLDRNSADKIVSIKPEEVKPVEEVKSIDKSSSGKDDDPLYRIKLE